MKIMTSDIVDDIKRVRDRVKQPPTKIQYSKMGRYGVNTVQRRLGRWNEVLIKVIGKVNRKEFIPQKIICPACQKEFTSNFNGQKYCSGSCSNADKPRRKKKLHSCRTCLNMISFKSSFCSDCKKLGRHLKGGSMLSERTIAEVTYGKGSNRYGVIRCHARKITKLRPQKCSVCQYDKHVETCHIKDIAEFPTNTKVGTVNHPDNLVLLCPTHHWELDHKLLIISDGDLT